MRFEETQFKFFQKPGAKALCFRVDLIGIFSMEDLVYTQFVQHFHQKQSHRVFTLVQGTLLTFFTVKFQHLEAGFWKVLKQLGLSEQQLLGLKL